jgi:hypothetical protein
MGSFSRFARGELRLTRIEAFSEALPNSVMYWTQQNQLGALS